MRKDLLIVLIGCVALGAAACDEDPTLTVVEEDASDEELLEEEVEATEDAVRVELPAVIAPRPLSDGRMVLEVGIGDGPDQLGGSGDVGATPGAEGDPGDVVGPQSLAAAGGMIWVLDGVKARIVGVDLETGLLGRELPLPTEGQAVLGDLAVTADGRFYVLEAGNAQLLELAADGTVTSVTPIDDEEDLPISLAVGLDGLPYVELSNGDVVQVVAPELGGDEDEPQLTWPGLPVGEDVFAYPVLVDDELAAVRFFDPDGILVHEVLFDSPGVAIAQVSRVAVSDAGVLYAVFDRVAEDPVTFETIVAEQLVVAVHPEEGLLGSVSVPMNDRRSGFRSLAISPEGGIFQLHLGPDRASVVEWTISQ